MTAATPDRMQTLATLPYLSPPEVAELLRVRLAKVRGWIATGELRASDVSAKRGRGKPRYRVSKNDLDVFLQGRRPTPPTRANRRRRDAHVIEFY